MPIRPTRVLHFVSDGFSSAAQVAVDLVNASLGRSDHLATGAGVQAISTRCASGAWVSIDETTI